MRRYPSYRHPTEANRDRNQLVPARFLWCTGAIPKELGNLTNLEELYLYNNDALEKPPGCPVDGDGDMYYSSKEKAAAFLRCLA